jgi:hypothetical protein
MTSLEAGKVARPIMTSLSGILSGILSESLFEKKKTLAYVSYLLNLILLHIIHYYTLYFHKTSNGGKFAQRLQLPKTQYLTEEADYLRVNIDHPSLDSHEEKLVSH